MTTEPATHKSVGYAQEGEMFRLRKKFPQAQAAFARALEENPSYAWAAAHLGATYRELGWYEEALRYLTQAIELTSDSYGWAYAQRGETYRLYAVHIALNPEADNDQIHGVLLKAVQDFDRAIALNSDLYFWALAHRGATYRELGAYYKRKPEHGQEPQEYLDRALADFNAAIERDGSYAWAWAYRAVIHKLSGNAEAALRDTMTATSLDPTIFGDKTYQQAMLFFLEGQYEEALELFYQGLRESPGDPNLLYGIAVCKARQGSEDAAHFIQEARGALSLSASLLLYKLAGLTHLEGDAEATRRLLQGANDLRAIRPTTQSLHGPVLALARDEVELVTALLEDEHFIKLMAAAHKE